MKEARWYSAANLMSVPSALGTNNLAILKGRKSLKNGNLMVQRALRNGSIDTIKDSV